MLDSLRDGDSRIDTLEQRLSGLVESHRRASAVRRWRECLSHVGLMVPCSIAKRFGVKAVICTSSEIHQAADLSFRDNAEIAKWRCSVERRERAFETNGFTKLCGEPRCTSGNQIDRDQCRVIGAKGDERCDGV